MPFAPEKSDLYWGGGMFATILKLQIINIIKL
ncbi:MAG: hypothetical protein RL757_1108 [Bacteroidota bacterium]|jgi:hypothetical protein